MNPNSALEICDLSLRLGGQQILHDINIEVAHGTIHALLGPNGAGKTTLIRCLTGSMPHKGTIRFGFRGNGRIGYVPQLLEFDHSLPLTVSDFLLLMLQHRPVLFHRSTAQRQQVLDCLTKTDSMHLVDRLIGNLSGGELRRVLLAQALTPVPEILLLDEPASNIDEVGARAFEQTLVNLRDEHGISIIMVSHDITTVARIADHATGINETVTWNGPGKSLRESDTLEIIFGSQTFSAEHGEMRIG